MVGDVELHNFRFRVGFGVAALRVSITSDDVGFRIYILWFQHIKLNLQDLRFVFDSCQGCSIVRRRHP